MQQELFSLRASEKRVSLMVGEVQGFLSHIDKDEEFDDIELDAVALSATAGGMQHQSVC